MPTLGALAGMTRPTQVDLTVSGDWVVPAGVFFIRALCVGGGGGGGGSYYTGNYYFAASGGSGGYLRTVELDVTPGQVLTITIGAGGPRGTYNNNPGSNGGITTVVSGAAITAAMTQAAGGEGGGAFGGYFVSQPVAPRYKPTDGWGLPGGRGGAGGCSPNYASATGQPGTAGPGALAGGGGGGSSTWYPGGAPGPGGGPGGCFSTGSDGLDGTGGGGGGAAAQGYSGGIGGSGLVRLSYEVTV